MHEGTKGIITTSRVKAAVTKLHLHMIKKKARTFHRSFKILGSGLADERPYGGFRFSSVICKTEML